MTAWGNPNICLEVEGGQRKCSNVRGEMSLLKWGGRALAKFSVTSSFSILDIYVVSIMNSSVDTPEKKLLGT